MLDGDDPATLDWASPKEECIQFIAACVELVQAWDNPEYETRLPLTFDASCSGLQHLCAMTRDEEGGRYVNLIPSEETDDFNVAYQVADDFYRRVERSSRPHAWRNPARLIVVPCGHSK